MPKFNPDPPFKPTFRPQFKLRPEDMRRMEQQAADATRDAATGELNDIGAGMGNQAGPDLMPDEFWARIYAPPTDLQKGPALYSFVEVLDDGSGSAWIPATPPFRGISNAHEGNNNLSVPVAGPPLGLVGLPVGQSFVYVVTSTWTSVATGQTYQSGESNEVSTTGGATLTWAPPASVAGYILSGYQIWRGTIPGGENVLVASVAANINTYTDGGGGSFGLPIPGGNVGPIVRMATHSAWDFYKFTYNAQNSPLAYVQPTTTTPSTVVLGRTITDAILNGTTTLVSPQQANFTAKDVGAVLVGTGIPGGTTIFSVTNGTTITMTASASAGVDVTVNIETGSIKGYSSVANYPDPVSGAWKRRTFIDGVVNGTTTLTSAQEAQFTAADVGAAVSGSSIPANTVINTVTNATTVVLNNSASGSTSNEAITLQQGTLPSAWLVMANDSVSYGGTPLPLTLIPVILNDNYQCRFFENDVTGTPIYVSDRTPTAYLFAGASSVSLTGSFATITGLTLNLPPNSVWRVSTCLAGQLSSSATATSDSLSAQYTNSGGVGVTINSLSVTWCTVPCSSVTEDECVTIPAIVVVGGVGTQLVCQGKINTSTGSTASITQGFMEATRLQ